MISVRCMLTLLFLACLQFGCTPKAIEETDAQIVVDPVEETIVQSVVEPDIEPLTIQGAHFVNADDEVVRFWGVNLCAVYPTKEQAEGLADELSDRQINLVRPHHMLRNSKDWVHGIPGGAMLTYKDTSRELDMEAMDRFDYLNARLREKGIYLAMSTHFTRNFMPGDVGILETTPEDEAAWAEGIEELRSWHWKKSFDPIKMLPVIDERCALLSEEFITNVLNHENPYTGLSYGEDPQVLTMEVINEFSSEYAIICHNKFPEYFQNKLTEKWESFCREAGVEEAGDIYKPTTQQLITLRAQFLRKLDEDYFLRMQATLNKVAQREIPLTFSNLFRSDNAADMHYQQSDWMENHSYTDPLITRKKDDGIRSVSRHAFAGKPFFIGELNQAEGGDNIKNQKPYRTMLPVAMAAYGLLQDWDGLVWFAWSHGDTYMGPDGRAAVPDRDSHLGTMMQDMQMQDHLRSMGLIFREGYFQKSVAPKTIWVEGPYVAPEYHSLVQARNQFEPGWQNIHGFRRAYGPEPEDQSTAPWMNDLPPNPLVSDTRELIKDVARDQLTGSSSHAEFFSGTLDGNPPAGLRHLQMSETEGFETLVLVSLDGKPLTESQHLLLSRTVLNKDLKEITGPSLELQNVLLPVDDQQWTMTITRGEKTDSAPSLSVTEESIQLPALAWQECEIILK
ncbi:hypothetical protein P3T73_03665 [Kiritimatiellota bacterium B12222]|nr:hypothetical protein P3T73_03665 [Kiritimatiellota bacterium B12222]